MAKKILIIDDEPDILRATKVRLVSFGYEVMTSGDGNGIVDLLRKNPPDLILLDLRLPRMDGDRICAMLKGDDEFRHIPIVIFTASNDPNTTKKVKESGAEGYIIKPFDTKELLETIEKFLN